MCRDCTAYWLLPKTGEALGARLIVKPRGELNNWNGILVVKFVIVYFRTLQGFAVFGDRYLACTSVVQSRVTHSNSRGLALFTTPRLQGRRLEDDVEVPATSEPLYITLPTTELGRERNTDHRREA